MKLTKQLRHRKKLVEKLGLSVLDITKKGKHPKFVVSNGKRSLKVTVPMTASDRRADKNMVAFLKREFKLAA